MTEKEPVYISRDPFARHTLYRVLVESKKGCDWCGQKRRGEKKLFQYQIHRDGSGIGILNGLFCCIGCKNSYHD